MKTKTFLKKCVLILCFLCFIGAKGFARSSSGEKASDRIQETKRQQQTAKETEGLEKPAQPQQPSGERSSARTRTKSADAANPTETQSLEKNRYNGDLHLTIGYGSGTYYKYGGYGGGYYGGGVESISGIVFGVENHNLYRIGSAATSKFSLGFMEDIYLGTGDVEGFEFLLGPAVGFQLGNFATVMYGLGLDINSEDVTFGHSFELRLFPNSKFGAAIGMRRTANSTFTSKIYIGCGWHF